MNSPEEEPTDDELADLMDDGASDTSESGDDEGAVEAGIPPALDSDDPELEVDEEAFSIDDFESNLSSTEETDFDENVVSEAVTSSEEETPTPTGTEEPKHEEVATEQRPKKTENGLGGVAEFRKTLTNLSRQLEIDRLAFLHKSLTDRGEELPTLEQIAGDIHGKSPMSPNGDCDYFGKRPATRLEGWISGLSFGSNRRAKKFSK